MATEYLNNKTFESLIVHFQQAKKERVKYQLFMDDILETQIRTAKRGKYQKHHGPKDKPVSKYRGQGR